MILAPFLGSRRGRDPREERSFVFMGSKHCSGQKHAGAFLLSSRVGNLQDTGHRFKAFPKRSYVTDNIPGPYRYLLRIG